MILTYLFKRIYLDTQIKRMNTLKLSLFMLISIFMTNGRKTYVFILFYDELGNLMLGIPPECSSSK